MTKIISILLAIDIIFTIFAKSIIYEHKKGI